MMNIEIIEKLISEANILLKPQNDINLYKNNGDSKYFFKVLTELANQLLRYKDERVLCKYKYLLLWRKYTSNLEGDLLVIVFLVNQSIYLPKFKTEFNWKLVIDHDNEELNYILKKGLADNHYHLGGALPVFQSIWLELIENKCYRNEIENLIQDEQQMLKKAVWIRQYLIEFLIKRNKSLIEDFNLKGLEKYYKERKFLFYIIREIIQDDSIGMQIKNFVYEYLIIKEWFRGFIVQTQDNIGQEYFFTTNDKKTSYLKLHNNLGEIIKTSINEQCLSNYIKILEVRIKMQSSPFQLYTYIKWLNEQIGYSYMKIHYIICFSRKINSLDDTHDKKNENQSKIISLEKQIEDLNIFLEKYPNIAKQVVGIDVCSNESNYKPEVFSELMIRKNNKADAKLKRMYHVGEYYSDLLSGLRSIDECISFFKLELGDRLGHAVPIFEDVAEWYNERNKRVLLLKEDYLDNIAWLYCNLPSNIQESKAGKTLLKRFRCLFQELYQNAFTNAEYNVKINFEKVNIYHYFESWKLRAQKPETIKRNLFECVYNENTAIIYYIAYCHFYNLEIKSKGQKLVKIYVSDEMITLTQKIQNIIQDKIKNKGIRIELCPSSNIFLGSVKKGYTHPLINVLKKQTNSLSAFDICVSINTDDQGIFTTSLMNEYSLLVNAFENETDNNGDKMYSKEFLYNWIDKIRENSIQMCY